MTNSPPSPPPVDRERNPARSREAILDAAERLFADRGFAATSLSDVGQVAGLSRATPGYFFGSKAELYRAVLDRCFNEARSAVLAGRDRAQESREPVAVIFAGLVRDYYEFLAARPAFVRLLERAALGDGPTPEANLALATGQDALAALVAELGLAPEGTRHARHLLLSMVALCWFPLVHGPTLLAAIDLDPNDPGFHDERKRHVVDLLLHGVGAELGLAPMPLPGGPTP